MKKIFWLILVLAFINSIIFAYGEQKLYLKSDYEYQELRKLAIQSGVVYPTTEPISGYEIINTLVQIPDESMSADIVLRKNTLINMVTGVKSTFKDKDSSIGIKFGASVNISLFYQNAGTQEKDTVIPYRDKAPFASLSMDAQFNNYAFLYLNFDLKDPIISNLFDSPAYFSNFDTLVHFSSDGISFFPSTGFMTQSYQPFKAGLSIGGRNFNFQIGRNRQSFGHGITGNLIVGDNFSFQEYAKISFFSKYFNYYFDITHFDQQNGEMSFEPFRMSGMHQYRVMHRFEVLPVDSFMISATLGSVFEIDGFDPRMLTPMFIVHSFNNFSENNVIQPGDEANNIMAIDISWAFLPNYFITAQIAMDQIELFYEPNSVPNAFAFLLNLQNTCSFKDAEFLNYFEIVYTMPYMYLNSKVSVDGTKNHNYDYILGYQITGGADIGYSGYKYGPDTLVCSIGSVMNIYEIETELNLFYKMHGIHGINQNSDFSDYPITSKYTYEHELSIIGSYMHQPF